MNIIQHILLIEDDEVDVLNVQRAFRKNNLGHKLHIAKNGLEALNMLKGDRAKPLNPLPKIILLDINMPKMNGIEFLKALRQDDELKRINVFILTTSDEMTDRSQAYDLNVAGYIIKPLEFSEFVQTIYTLNQFWELSKTA